MHGNPQQTSIKRCSTGVLSSLDCQFGASNMYRTEDLPGSYSFSSTDSLRWQLIAAHEETP
ncbi:hypothetical protein EMIT0P294_10865 [Pseudomonas sp. IT-P294]